MNIKIIAKTENPITTMAIAAKTCYSKLTPNCIRFGSETEAGVFLEKIIARGHHSVLEHASFTFAISGISRNCANQIVRHRIASYSQQSQRYVEFAEDDSSVYLHDSLRQNEKVQQHLKNTKMLYEELVESGVKVEDARGILVGGTLTNLVMTMNVRSLIHFLKLRTCSRAQKEVRIVANTMLNLLTRDLPFLSKEVSMKCLQCRESKYCEK